MRMLVKIKYIFNFLLFLGLAACLEEPDSMLLEEQTELFIFGSLRDETGQAVDNAEIFIEDQLTPIAVSDSDGDYSFQVSAEELVRVKGRLPVQSSGMRLYFQKLINQDERLIGMSPSVNLFLTGELNLGITILDQGIAAQGRVWALPRNQDLEPAVGARVILGRWQVFTDEEGRFQFPFLPRGQLPMSVMASAYGPFYSSLLVEPGLMDSELEPVVLFPEYGVSGALLLQNPGNELSQIEAVLRPFRKSFRVYNSPQATWVRLHHKRESLEADEKIVSNEQGVPIPKAKWVKISKLVDYDFPAEGTYTVYYQFANQDQSETSDIFQLPVLMDRFGASTGLTIEEGQEVVSSSRVNVTIDLPVAATRMRIAESEYELLQKGWLPAVENLVYDFGPLAEQPSNLRQLLLQFQDSFGNASRIYKASVRLVLFPENSNFIVVNGGLDITSDPTVQIEISLPENAYEMRVFEETSANTGGNGTNPAIPPPAPLWMQAQELIYYTFQQSGCRNLLIQFRDQNANQSLIYQKNICYMP